MATKKSSCTDTITIGNGMNFDDMVLDLGSMSTVTLGNIDDTITLDFGDLHSTWPGLSVAGDVGLNNSLSTSVSGQLTGDAADLTINGVSLAKTLEGIQQRLNMLQPNPEMEAQWDELRELGQRYRELEQQCIEKSRMWAQLTSMPPPEIS